MAGAERVLSRVVRLSDLQRREVLIYLAGQEPAVLSDALGTLERWGVLEESGRDVGERCEAAGWEGLL